MFGEEPQDTRGASVSGAAGGHAAAFTLQRYTHHYDVSVRRTADAMGNILPDEP